MEMEDETSDNPSTFSDDEVGFISNKSSRKSALLLSDDESERDVQSDQTEDKKEKDQSDSGVDDSIIGNDLKKDRSFKRVKRYDSSDSEKEDTSEDSDKEMEEHDKSISKKNKSEESLIQIDMGHTKRVTSSSHTNSDNDHQDDSLREENIDLPSVQKKYQELFKDDIYDAEGSSDEDKRDPQSDDFPSEPVCELPKKKIFKKGKEATKKYSSKTKKGKEVPSKLDEIHKESQRMVRESLISLPYHVPRQRTLQDFLNRRKSVPKIPLKSNSEELSIVWKHIEECEKTAESFYNSESEESDKEKDNDKLPLNEEVPINLNEVEEKTNVQNNDKAIESVKTDFTGEALPSENSNFTGNLQSSNESGFHSIESSNIEKSDKVPLVDYVKDTPCSKNDKFENDMNNKFIKISEMQNDNCSSESNEVETKKCSNSEYTFFGVPIEVDELNEEEMPVSQSHIDDVQESNKNILDDTDNDEEFSNHNLNKSLLESLDKSFGESSNINVLDKSTSEKQSNDKTLTPGCVSLLNKVPKLSCGPDNEIDLDQPIGGVDHFYKRFMKHIKLKNAVPKKEKAVKLSVLSVESSAGGEVTSLTEDELIISCQEIKPGQKLCALKQTLKKSIDVSRSQLLAKRIEQFKIYEQEFYDEEGGSKKIDEDGDEEFENELFGDKDTDEVNGNGNDSDNYENDNDDDDEEKGDVLLSDEEIENTKLKKEPKKKSDFLDEEVEVSEDGNEESDDDEDDNDAYSLTQGTPDKFKSAKKSLEFEDEFSQDSPIKRLDLSGLGLDKDSDEESDLLGLCSGKFQTQPVSLTQLEANSSQSYNPCTPALENFDNRFSQEMFSQRSIKPIKIVDSDEEENNTQSVKSARNIKPLCFSDDEDESKHENQEEDEKGEESDDELESINEIAEEGECSDEEISAAAEVAEMRDIHYDSEEEIVEGKKFLDVEAELSGSEASEDEDEKGLSDFEADEADMEKINQDKVRSELEKIHMQDLLAKDKREIRLLQELLLEDGELHSDGPKRQRLYRWSNQEDAENVLGKIALSDEESGAIEDEEEDHLWRKQRIEREQFLNSTKREEEAEVLDENINLPVSDKKIIKQHAAPKLQNNLLSSPDPKQPFKLLTNRGSFLGRSERVLSKLAGLAAPTDQQQRVKRNMVFSVVSPPKAQDDPSTELEKRKANEDIPRVTKKLKFNQSITKTTQSLGIIQKLMESDT